MDIPAWVDQEYSKQLRGIREGGENQHAEFIVDFSNEPREVAKEVAAFATSGGGKIFLGVKNDGNVGGLNGDDHDKMLHRVQGIVRTVYPPVKYKLHLCHDDGFILVIDVPQKQDQPLYFVEGRPYVRDFRESRPAKPEEVNERVWSHPSSAQRLRDEELKHDMKKAAWELSVKRTAAADAASAKSTENILRTNDMLRQSVIPK
jgi:predicted HTH transcriptional regulator